MKLKESLKKISKNISLSNPMIFLTFRIPYDKYFQFIGRVMTFSPNPKRRTENGKGDSNRRFG
jgi:hypothetical protein